MVICLEKGANDLHMVQLMSLPPHYCRIANLKGPYFRPSLSVCLFVCLWPALLPFNIDRFWWNLVTRTLLWSSLDATIIVHIGRRGTARRLFENFKKFPKITEFEFQNSGLPFFASVSPVYCKKNSTWFEQKLFDSIDSCLIGAPTSDEQTDEQKMYNSIMLSCCADCL